MHRRQDSLLHRDCIAQNRQSLHVQAAAERRGASLGKEASLQRPRRARCGSVGHCGSAPQPRCCAQDQVQPLRSLVGCHAVWAERRVATVPVQDLRAGRRPHCRRALNACIQKFASHMDTTRMTCAQGRTMQRPRRKSSGYATHVAIQTQSLRRHTCCGSVQGAPIPIWNQRDGLIHPPPQCHQQVVCGRPAGLPHVMHHLPLCSCLGKPCQKHISIAAQPDAESQKQKYWKLYLWQKMRLLVSPVAPVGMPELPLPSDAPLLWASCPSSGFAALAM